MAVPRRLFGDTSFFFACLDPSDRNHRRAVALLVETKATGSVLTVTWDVIGETVTLLRYRASFPAAVAFLAEVKPQLLIATYGDRVRTEAEQVFRRFARDHRLSFCDAISFVVVTTLLNNAPCLAFDEDFRHLGLSVLP